MLAHELAHVVQQGQRRVTVQTNLSFDLAAFLDRVEAGKLALWTTYHPTEVPGAEPVCSCPGVRETVMVWTVRPS